MFDILLADNRRRCANQATLDQRASRTEVTNQDENGKGYKTCRECTVDEESVVDGALVNVTGGGRVDKVTLLRRVHIMHRGTLPQIMHAELQISPS